MENQIKLRTQKTNWKYILIVLILAIFVGGGIFGYIKYYIKEMVSLTKFSEIKKPKTPEIEIRRLIQNFYQALENQNGELLFSYFTPPQTPEEKESYNWLIGVDLPEPIYRVFSRVKISNSQIEKIKEIEGGKFQVEGRDEINISKAPAYPEEIETISRKVIFIVIKTDDKWLVGKYKWEDPNKIYRTEKYSGFGHEQIISDLANWNTYRNEEYGFEMKYPEDFFDKMPTATLTDCDLINFPKQCPDITEAVKNLTGKDLDSELRHAVGALQSVPFNDLLQEQEKEQKVGDLSFCKLLVADCGMGSCTSDYYYTIPKDNKCLTIYFRKTASSCSAYYGLPEYEKEYNECVKFLNMILPNTISQMLSTFKFLE